MVRLVVHAVALIGDNGKLFLDKDAGYLIDTRDRWIAEYGRDESELVDVEIYYTPKPPKMRHVRKPRYSSKQIRAFRAAAVQLPCPGCKAKAGERCMSKASTRNKRIAGVHDERIGAAMLRAREESDG